MLVFKKVASTVVASMLFLTICIVGDQSTATASPQQSQSFPIRVCDHLYGAKGCAQSTPYGIEFTWTGTRVHTGGEETVTVNGKFTGSRLGTGYTWNPQKSNTYSAFFRLKKPDIYQCTMSIGEPPTDVYPKFFQFTLLVPNFGTSKMKVITNKLPTIKQGVKYMARIVTRYGVPPYHYLLLGYQKIFPPGMHFVTFGRNAGTLYGTPRNIIANEGPTKFLFICIIVRDKLGHSVFGTVEMFLNP